MVNSTGCAGATHDGIVAPGGSAGDEKELRYAPVSTPVGAMESARNPVSFMVPGRGVVRSDGRAEAYSGGEGIEERLLELEGVGVADVALAPAAAR